MTVSEKHMAEAKRLADGVALYDLGTVNIAQALSTAHREGFDEGIRRAADAIGRQLDDIYVRDGFCDWADVATARDAILAELTNKEPTND